MAFRLGVRALLGITATATAQSLPYISTRILPSLNHSLVYIFEPQDSSGFTKLLSVNTTTSISISSFEPFILLNQLPFEDGGQALPYTPIIDGLGNITIIAGDCSSGSHATQVWRFQPEIGSAGGNGSWTQYPPVYEDMGDGAVLTGSNYLAGGVSFPGGAAENATSYTFGGMCPLPNSTADTWTSDAHYSNQVLVADPNKDGVEMSMAATNGPPIAEAGFSITGLTPFSSSETVAWSARQQQDFVLLGGHTETAFINMSQVALFSLPQESWTFLPVQAPSSEKTDLAARQSTSAVEPRSGHTAVLSEDGSSIIVLGGWVGDISNPANPQLLILKMGSGYGGDGDWIWEVPDTTGSSGLQAGEGVYGHGAVMLPGGVMMVSGGSPISAASSGRTKRQASSHVGQVMLLNTTSWEWQESWSPPTNSSAIEESSSETHHGALSKGSQKAGLAGGLVGGLAVLAGLIVFYIWYTRRLRRARETREQRRVLYSSDGSSIGQMEQPFLNKGGLDGRGGEMTAVGSLWRAQSRSAQNTYPWDPAGREGIQSRPRDADATGLFTNIPSPTRGLRKGLNTRPYSYHQAPRYDEKRAAGSGQIHPIAERDDEDEQSMHSHRNSRERREAERQLLEVERALRPRPVSDPFMDPLPNPLGSHPVSPEIGETVKRVPTQVSRSAEVPRSSHGELDNAANWTAEYPREVSPHPRTDGRISPARSDERTSSTLSEQSAQSALSSSSLARTMSTRTGMLLAAAAAAMTNRGLGSESSNSDERSHTMSSTNTNGRKSPFFLNTRARSSTNASGGVPNSAGTDADSFTTARSSNFIQLQAEGEALLGGRPTVGRDDPYGRAMATVLGQSSQAESDGLYGIPNAIPPRRRGLMGSLRRAIGVMAPAGPRSMSLTTNSEQQYAQMGRSASSSPTKEHPSRIGSSPRRALSDGGALLRQKRGKHDWQDEQHWAPYRDDPDAGDWGQVGRTSLEKRQAEEEWDVEDAAQKRDVQFLFTVPKSRLRVVNEDIERASMRSASDSALSRSESTRSHQSLKAAKGKGDGERVVLPSTKEEEGDEAGSSSGKEKSS
ncbi:hypothetical protein K431DRAFT_287494 [Polychaeton citri CBS 116435]|uniref:Galactose oxidase n=1 Tax=Polychaeton citri CBS 116435 TaxID=1314669 RepID=A0A9P4Q5X5_9PEZI|nr:hypothetical protein K431DRAFT_287494 [Polychaeton citri CBS 116435]